MLHSFDSFGCYEPMPRSADTKNGKGVFCNVSGYISQDLFRDIDTKVSVVCLEISKTLLKLANSLP